MVSTFLSGSRSRLNAGSYNSRRDINGNLGHKNRWFAQTVDKSTDIKEFRVLLSRPARARGLKLTCIAFNAPITAVAPRAGAWIETQPPSRLHKIPQVAPRAGAWIETLR